MSTVIENLLYLSGLTAQGSWDQLDEYDRQSILRLISLTAAACMTTVEQTAGEQDSPALISALQQQFAEKFGVDQYSC